MKILFIIHALTGGGAERVMATLMNIFCQRGYEVSLLTDTSIPFAYDVDERVQRINLHQPCPAEIKGVRRYLWGYSIIRNAAKESKCDVAVSFLSEMNCTTILALMGSGIPLVCSEHSNILRKYPGNLLKKRGVLYHFPDALTVLTHHDFHLWRKKYNNCVRMPNPSGLVTVDLSKPREKVILAVGRVNQWKIKGFDNLIRAWGLICNCFIDWKLQIVGDYDDVSLEVLKGVISESHAKNVDFIGFRRDVDVLMRRSAVFCLSSRVEGLPMALIEAMGCGCCCVAADCVTGPGEIISDGKSGLLAKADDVQSLSEKLRLVLSNEELRIKLSKNAPTGVEQFDTERVADRWNILFKKIMRRDG